LSERITCLSPGVEVDLVLQDGRFVDTDDLVALETPLFEEISGGATLSLAIP
jgi:hypothetical protein